jgi:mono/diheme cytochrome c family protein
MTRLRLRGGVAAALLVVGLTGAAQAQDQRPGFLPQGWGPAERQWYYTVSQGAQMMPYSWFMALERAADDKPFAGELAGFGYLPNPKSTLNPDGLPVGFVKDTDPGNRSEWIGLNCSACHTNQVNFAGHLYQIDGAPTNADMFWLIDGVAKALAATATSVTDPKFVRFADKVLPAKHTPGDLDQLLANLKEFSAYFTNYVKNSTTTVPWGRARLDAFGMIFNRATAIDLKIDSNNKPPDAPVSYPFLWDTHWHNVVQWNGSAPNRLAIERLVRNVGEVIGVFANADIKHEFFWPHYSLATTARRANQLQIEDQLSRLHAPAWPVNLSAINPAAKVRGAALYRTYCSSCHALATPGQPQDVTMTPLSEVQTDPRMASNAANRMTDNTGVLDGATIPPIPIIVTPVGPTSSTVELVARITVGAVLAPASKEEWDVVLRLAKQRKQSDLVNLANGQLQSTTGVLLSQETATQVQNYAEKQRDAAQELKYKARPLDGIWATAPYLHNGSVPNLWQLLLPAGERDKKFWVGSREIDTKNVGFKTDQVPGGTEFDTSLPGNSNSGHDSPAYGGGKMTEEQRWDLIEYLKSL